MRLRIFSIRTSRVRTWTTDPGLWKSTGECLLDRERLTPEQGPVLRSAFDPRVLFLDGLAVHCFKLAGNGGQDKCLRVSVFRYAETHAAGLARPCRLPGISFPYAFLDAVLELHADDARSVSLRHAILRRYCRRQFRHDLIDPRDRGFFRRAPGLVLGKAEILRVQM